MPLAHDWEARARAGGFDVEIDNDGWSVGAEVLDASVEEDRRLLSIFGHECRVKSDTATAHWSFSALVPPDTDPPDRVRLDTEKFGSTAGCLSAVADIWPDKEPVTWRFSIELLLDPGKWESALGGQRMMTSFTSEGVTFSPYYMAWQASDHPRIRNILVVLDESRSITAVSVRGTIELPVSPETFRLLDKAIWSDLLVLLTPTRQS